MLYRFLDLNFRKRRKGQRVVWVGRWKDHRVLGHDQNILYEILFKKNAKRTETLLYVSEVKKTWRVRQ